MSTSYSTAWVVDLGHLVYPFSLLSAYSCLGDTSTVIHVRHAKDNAILICHFCMLDTLTHGGASARSVDVPDPL